MADFMQKYVNSYNARYIEAILQILMAKLTFLNTTETGLACLKQLDCFRAERNSKWRPKWRLKPEIRISQLLDKIATPFQRLPPHFCGPSTQRHYCRYFPMYPDVGNSRWRPPNRVETGSTYISASRKDSNAVPF